MSESPRELLKGFLSGMRELGETHPEQAGAFMNLLGKFIGPGALDVKTKELIAIGISVYNRCPYCIAYHSHQCLKSGATREEILDAAFVSVGFGGGPSMAYTVTLLKQCLDEFKNDFKK